HPTTVGTSRTNPHNGTKGFMTESTQTWHTLLYVVSLCFLLQPGEQQLIPIEIALMKMVCKAPVSPGIIQLIDWSVSHSEVVLILEHPEPCLNLLDFLSKRKKFLGERLARRIFLQVVEALQHCQARGVFHRDVKVDNVLIQSFTHQIKLIDFGCGALLQEDEYTSYRGTRKYAPPEWFTKRRYLAEPATVWSLGILLYMLLYGSIPFEKKEETIKGKVKFHRKVSRECWNLIRRCLSLHPADRPSLTDILGHSWETTRVLLHTIKCLSL
uniref:non-specific serine/threonine protein kinase n=1 Tax=Erpetoichthys calabaricus TaxID=27687 RepID=A0A8C4T8C5_ERPCA